MAQERAPLFTNLNIDQERLQAQQANQTYRQKSTKNFNNVSSSSYQSYPLSSARSSYKENQNSTNEQAHQNSQGSKQPSEEYKNIINSYKQIQISNSRQQKPSVPRLNLPQNNSTNINDGSQHTPISQQSSYQQDMQIHGSVYLSSEPCSYNEPCSQNSSFQNNFGKSECSQDQQNSYSQTSYQQESQQVSDTTIQRSSSYQKMVQQNKALNNFSPQVEKHKQKEEDIVLDVQGKVDSKQQSGQVPKLQSKQQDSKLQVFITPRFNSSAHTSRTYRQQSQKGKGKQQGYQYNVNSYRQQSARSIGQANKKKDSPRQFVLQQNQESTEQPDWHFTLQQVTGRSISPRAKSLQEAEKKNIQVNFASQQNSYSQSTNQYSQSSAQFSMPSSQYLQSSNQNSHSNSGPKQQGQLNTFREDEQASLSQLSSSRSSVNEQDTNNVLQNDKRLADENKNKHNTQGLKAQSGDFNLLVQELRQQQVSDDTLLNQMIQSNNQLLKEKGQLQLNLQKNQMEKMNLAERLDYFEKIQLEETQQKEQLEHEIQQLKEQLTQALKVQMQPGLNSLEYQESPEQVQKSLNANLISQNLLQQLQSSQRKQEMEQNQHQFNPQLTSLQLNTLFSNNLSQNYVDYNSLRSKHLHSLSEDSALKNTSLGLQSLKEPPGFGSQLKDNVKQEQALLNMRKQGVKFAHQPKHSQSQFSSNSLLKYQSLPNKQNSNFSPQLPRQLQTDTPILTPNLQNEPSQKSQLYSNQSVQSHKSQSKQSMNMYNQALQHQQQQQQFIKHNNQNPLQSSGSSLDQQKLEDLQNQYAQNFINSSQGHYPFNLNRLPYGHNFMDMGNNLSFMNQSALQSGTDTDLQGKDVSSQQQQIINQYQSLDFNQLQSISEILG